MTTGMWASLIVASIVLNGFFAGMETGIMSARRVRLLHWAGLGRRGARIAAGLVQAREKSLVAAVVGNNVAIVTGTALATAWAVSELGSRGETVAALTMASLNIVFGEILPKTAFRARPETLTIAGAAVFRLMALILWPLQFLALSGTRIILAVLRQSTEMEEEILTRVRLVQLFALSRERQQLDAGENRLLADFVGNSHRPVSEVMTAWDSVSRVPVDATVREVFDQVRETGHSRLPVELQDGSLRGLVLYRDLQGLEAGERIDGRIRDYLRIPEWMGLDEAIAVLTDRQVSLAVVIGAGPAPKGIVTVEDLLEPFVGEILDEHDETEIPNKLR